MRSREGDEVTWTQQVSCLAGTLSNWMSTTNDDTPFPTDIPSPALCMLKAIFTHARSTPAPILSSCSLEELMAVMSGANFLEANDAFRAGARQLNQRFLAGKSVEELRAVLSAEKDLSEADQAATLAEPAFTPPGGSVVGGGVLEDLLEEALRETDAAALCRLKAVSASWRSRARRELCNRLCRREGQVAPSTFESITDLDVERLRSVARPWAVAAVARWLPQLARLHGYGFVVDVHAVRQAALPPLGQPALRGPLGGAALRGCITGEGPPPAELLLAAVACQHGQSDLALARSRPCGHPAPRRPTRVFRAALWAREGAPSPRGCQGEAAVALCCLAEVADSTASVHPGMRSLRGCARRAGAAAAGR